MNAMVRPAEVDILELLHNWAKWVQWGDDGLPHHDELCGSIERYYATATCRFQYEPPAPRQEPPRYDDGALLEKLIADRDFPAIWKRVLRVEFIDRPYRHADEDSEIFLQRKAALARVSWRSYPDYVDGALDHLTGLLTR